MEEMRGRWRKRWAGSLPGSAEAEALVWKHHCAPGVPRILADTTPGRKPLQRVLTGLGFRGEDRERECSTFSAGWQMRIALARAILERPDILLLDEPTNYLDIEARAWLSGFLADFPGGLLLVSHDRWFLDSVVTAVAEIFLARLSLFSGNYSHYEDARSGQLASLQERWRLQQEEIARIEAFIAKFRYNASKARLVQSRIIALEKMERVEVPPVVKIHPLLFSASTASRKDRPLGVRARQVLRRPAGLSRSGHRSVPGGQARGCRRQRRRQVNPPAVASPGGSSRTQVRCAGGPVWRPPSTPRRTPIRGCPPGR